MSVLLWYYVGFLTSIENYVWSDGNDYYYSEPTSTADYQYVLDKSTRTWNPMTWNGMTSFDGSRIWTDLNENVYYNSNYSLDEDTNTWVKMLASRFDGETQSFENISVKEGVFGKYVWTDGEKYYYSNDTAQYVMTTNSKQ